MPWIQVKEQPALPEVIGQEKGAAQQRPLLTGRVTEGAGQ
jgi:hypothetical protein